MEANPESRDPVKLVVKSPNQQFEDHTVDCEPRWSVKKLKEHLSEVYPCKPTPEEQKLIYSGQLLKDQLLLKDVLRHYDDPQPQFHILHLVYSPKNQQHIHFITAKSSQKTNDKISNDGLRQRHVVSNQNQEIQSQSASGTSATLNNATGVTNTATTSSNCPTSGPFSNVGTNIPGFGFPQEPNQYMLAQQIAMQNWLQQAYIQYMNQYMSLLPEGMRPEATFMQHQAQFQMPYLPSQNLPFSQPMFGQNLSGSSLPPQSAAAAATDAQIGSAGDGAANSPAPAVAAAAAPQQPQAQNPQPQPRFPNLVQENPEENRDWLDIFYSMIRVMVLLTLVYFYSSALRCAVVIFIGLAIYLYHIGFFRRQMQAREANNNNVAAAVENIQQQQQQQHNQGANGQQQENNRRNDEEPPAEGRGMSPNREGANDSAQLASSSVPEAPEANGNSVIAFVRTFVVSFFVSLLPEAPAL